MAPSVSSCALIETMLAVIALAVVLMASCSWFPSTEPLQVAAPKVPTIMPSLSQIGALSSFSTAPLSTTIPTIMLEYSDVTSWLLAALSAANTAAAAWLPAALVVSLVLGCTVWSRMRVLHNQLQGMSALLTEAQEAAASAQRELVTCTEQLAAIQGHHAASRQQLAAARAEHELMKQQLTAAHSRHAGATQQLAAAEVSRQGTAQQLAAAQDELCTARQQLEAAEAEHATTNDELATLILQHESSVQQLATTQVELATSQRELTAVQQDYAITRQLLAHAVAEHETARQQLADANAAMNSAQTVQVDQTAVSNLLPYNASMLLRMAILGKPTLKPLFAVLRLTDLLTEIKSRSIQGVVTGLKELDVEAISSIEGVNFVDNPTVHDKTGTEGVCDTLYKKQAKCRSISYALVLLYHISASDAILLANSLSGVVLTGGFAAACERVYNNSHFWTVPGQICDRVIGQPHSGGQSDSKVRSEMKNRKVAACLVASLLLQQSGVVSYLSYAERQSSQQGDPVRRMLSP